VVSFPVGDQHRFGVGAQYAMSDLFTPGFAYEFHWEGDVGLFQGRGPVRGTVAGQFSGANIYIFCTNLVWKNWTR
jgi:long-chain fatty acid transport protein